MKTDFLDAHLRHRDDATRLFEAQRWANADHLYGLAAECGIKRLMLAFGMPFDADDQIPAEKKDRVHANGIWARLESYSNGYMHGAAYALPADNPFADWTISDRYAHQSQFSHDQARMRRDGALFVSDLIKRAQREGLLS